MADVPKATKRLLREWAAVAHERDLRKALGGLRREFDRLERGEIDAFELNDMVHRYHNGASREIWKRYTANHVEAAIAFAVVSRVLQKEELPQELRQHVARWIEFYEKDWVESEQ